MSNEDVLVNLLTKIRSEIDDVLINKNDIQSPKLSKSPIQEGDLTFREKEILEYIKLNPGKTKQQIVDYFDQEGIGKYSRVTIFKTFSHLEKYGLIVVSPDQNNSQIHHLYINNESTLSLLIQDFETFKNAFFVLLDKINEKYNEFFEEFWNNPDNKVKFMALHWIVELSKGLIYIYKYFINVNLTRILFNWPDRTKASGISEKISSIFFIKMREIQLKMTEVMTKFITVKDSYSQFADLLLNGSYDTDTPLIGLFKFFKYMNMEKEIKDILECLMKLSKGLFPLEKIYLKLKQNGILLKEF